MSSAWETPPAIVPAARIAVALGALALLGFPILASLIDPRPELARAEQEQAERVRLEQLAAADLKPRARNNLFLHTADLERLQNAVASKPDTRCTGSNRSTLRFAISRYVIDRARAVALAGRYPGYDALEAIWRTPADASALSDARSLMNEGFLLAGDFEDWPKENDAVMTLPQKTVSQCWNTIDEALAEDAERRRFGGSGDYPRTLVGSHCGALTAGAGAAQMKCR